jgi:hypothetical protein
MLRERQVLLSLQKRAQRPPQEASGQPPKQRESTCQVPQGCSFGRPRMAALD